jgi:hypothetical protein
VAVGERWREARRRGERRLSDIGAMVEADARWGQDRHGHDTTRWTGGAEAGWVLEAEAGKGKGKDDDNDDSNDSNDNRAGQAAVLLGGGQKPGLSFFQGRGQAWAGAGAFHRPERALALQTTVQPSSVKASPSQSRQSRPSSQVSASPSASASASTEARPVLGWIRRLVDSPSTPRHAFAHVLSPWPLP